MKIDGSSITQLMLQMRQNGGLNKQSLKEIREIGQRPRGETAAHFNKIAKSLSSIDSDASAKISKGELQESRESEDFGPLFDSKVRSYGRPGRAKGFRGPMRGLLKQLLESSESTEEDEEEDEAASTIDELLKTNSTDQKVNAGETSQAFRARVIGAYTDTTDLTGELLDIS